MTSLDSITHLRRGLINFGYRITPCEGKRAVMGNWQNAKADSGHFET